MMLFRSAVKQICRRHGHLATFMCRPRVPNTLASGWHLHQSLADRRHGANAFAPIGEGGLLSAVGRDFLGGLIEHARAGAAFATPTINGYKRYRAYALAPDRVSWGRDNRGAMVRVLGGRGNATRLENRIGEPAANPYLYMASQVLSGLDGMQRNLDPGASADTPYEAAAPSLPLTLEDALAALRQDTCFAEGLGQGFIDYYLRLKEFELARYRAEVTEWEQREYFELF
jgi:glutamine synthetase